MKIKSLMFLPNGNTACFDERGQQIPELQLGYLQMWCKYAESLGYKPEEINEVLLSSGRAKIIKTEDGYNWKMT